MGAAKILITGLFCLPLAFGGPVFALTVKLQGNTRSLVFPGSQCVDIGGEYEGFRVEPTERGKVPYICYGTQLGNTLRVFDATIIATNAGVSARTLEFEHEFFTGPQGIIYAEVQLNGFAATASGEGVPSGDQISMHGYLRQHGAEARIGKSLGQEITKAVDSALLDKQTREQFLVGGKRTLKGVLRFSLQRVGDKLVLGPETAVVLSGVKELVERLGELSGPAGAVPSQTGEPSSPGGFSPSQPGEQSSPGGGVLYQPGESFPRP